MLYSFPDIFYKSVPSPCAPSGGNQSLSDGDRRGLSLLYPQTAVESEALLEIQSKILSGIAGEVGIEFEAAATQESNHLTEAASILRANLKSVD